jgi:hypothetical protein
MVKLKKSRENFIMFTSSVRLNKRLFNIAIGIFVLASLALLPGIFANRFTQTVHADSNDKAIVRNNDELSIHQPIQKRAQPFVGAINGEAFILEEKTQGVEIVRLKTSMPVFKAFGLSSDGRKLLYTSLKNGVPSGELYLEDLSTGKHKKVTSHLVLSAALSPVDDNRIAYTFSGGETFGLAVTELDSRQNKTFVSENIFAEIIQWDDSGKGIHYFETTVQDSNLNLSSRYVSVTSSPSDNTFRTGVPSGFPMLGQRAIYTLGFQTLEENKEAQNDYAFRAVTPDGVHEVVGRNLLGTGRLSAHHTVSGKNTALGEGQLLKVLQTGVVIKEFSSASTKLQFIDWEGNATSLGMTVVNYNLPMQNSTMIQGGAGYAPPGNCSITAHTGALEYAYDFQTPTVGAHAMASADGLVVFVTSFMTCNMIDTDCPDYSASGCPGSYLGNIVIIQHADGTYTKYAHMETNSPQAVVGTNVCQGLYIGRQGHTGTTSGGFNSCGDHLHFQRQSSPDIFGQSVAVDFADVAIEPLSCGANYTSASTEVAHSISPNSQSFGITGGNGNVNVTSTGCNWSATSNDAWITITSAGSGSGNDVVAYSVADNSAGSPRTGTMNIAGHIFTVSQDGTQPPNQAPTANAGSDQTITLPSSANLSGTATDDGLPNPPATLTTTWSKVSGPGSVTFGDANALNTTASFSLAGVYVLRLTASDSVLSATDDLTVIVNINNGGGTLTGTQTTHPSNIDLTMEGTSDWAHWGLSDASSFNHKNGVTQLINNYTPIGTISPIRFANNMNSYSWSDGTPTTTSNTTTGVYYYGIGNGFQITVPADTIQRTLKLYVGLWAAGGRLEATLSDGSASPYINTSLLSGGADNGVFTLNYRSPTNGQTLTVRWTVNSNTNALGNVTLQAATLAIPTNLPPVVNAGNDQTITLPSVANLSGTASDDGLPNPPAALTTTWSQVSGTGTVTFGDANALNTTASFSLAGVYVLRLTVNDSAVIVTDDVIVTVNVNGGTGVISGNSSSTPANVNLTMEGTSAWTHWGLNNETSFNYKNGATEQISNYTAIGSGTAYQYTNNSTSYSWNDGAPSAIATNTTAGIFVIGLNNGFQITVPADTTPRTVKLYVGLWLAGGRFEAALSDGSTSPYVDTTLVNQTGGSNAVYTLNYRAGSNGQTLILRWIAGTTFDYWGNVTLQAATLSSSSFEADVAPRPFGTGTGFLSTADVVQIRRFLAGLDMPYQNNELQRADCAPLSTLGNGSVSTADVIQARRFLAGLDQISFAGGPSSFVSYENTSLFSPLLLYSYLADSSLVPHELSVVRVSRTGNKVVVAVEFESQGNAEGIGFSLNYDTAVLSNPANITLGTGSTGATLTVNSTQVGLGRLGIALDKAPGNPFPPGAPRIQLVTIEFDVIPMPPPTTTISFGDMPIAREVILSDNTILTPTANPGVISLLPPTASTVFVGGRVTTATGRGVSKAVVTMTNSAGEQRIVLTNSFGYYRFAEVEVGETYTFTVSSKRYNFSQPTQVLSIVEETFDVNFVADN